MVEKWLKREGEEFKAGDSLCEVLLMPGDLMVAVDAKEDGVVGKLLASVGQTVAVNNPILQFLSTKEEYFEFVDEMRQEASDDVKEDAAEDISKNSTASSSKTKVDTKMLMRYVKRLLHEGAFKEGSGTFSICCLLCCLFQFQSFVVSELAKRVQSLARNGNSQLMSTFEASFEGDSLADESFDEKFFVENVTDLVAEIDKAEVDKDKVKDKH